MKFRFSSLAVLLFAFSFGGGGAMVSNVRAGESASTAPATVTVRELDASGNLGAPVQSPKVSKTDAEWRAQLSKEQFEVTRQHGTEPPGTGALVKNHKQGIYLCVGCGLPLFSSDAKFESGTGWPSFFQPIAKENIGSHSDESYGMIRTEVHCPRCEAHLGHVFDDGPKPTGLRYCINSASLTFQEQKVPKP